MIPLGWGEAQREREGLCLPFNDLIVQGTDRLIRKQSLELKFVWMETGRLLLAAALSVSVVLTLLC